MIDLGPMVASLHELAASWEESPAIEYRAAAPLLRLAADAIATAQRIARRGL